MASRTYPRVWVKLESRLDGLYELRWVTVAVQGAEIVTLEQCLKDGFWSPVLSIGSWMSNDLLFAWDEVRFEWPGMRTIWRPLRSVMRSRRLSADRHSADADG